MTFPKCCICENRIYKDDEFRCHAYPEGIPDDILGGYVGDNCRNGYGYKEPPSGPKNPNLPNLDEYLKYRV